MKVVWTEQAFLQLAEIEDHIARDNPAAAERLTERLIARAERLADQPGLGRALPELPQSGLRDLVEGNYRMVYRARGDAVELLTVFEGHRLLRLDELGFSD